MLILMPCVRMDTGMTMAALRDKDGKTGFRGVKIKTETRPKAWCLA